jgi:heat shock protein HslJ
MRSKIIATMVVVILGAWLLPGCKLFTEEVSLPGSYWTLVSLNSHELLPDSIISVAFKTSELIPIYLFGRMGCNDYSSPVELDEERSGALHPTDVRVATNRSCLSPGLLEQEGEYLAALRSIRAYEISRSRLAMKNQAGQVVLEFRRDTVGGDDTLPGTRWNLETLNGHALIPNRAIWVAIVEGGTGFFLSGHAGCNTYGSHVELVDGQIIRLSLPDIVGVVTDAACIEHDLMEQERKYLDALYGITAYEISDGRLELKNQAGEVVLVFHKDPKSIDPALLNKVWLLETLNDQPVIPDSRIIAAFDEELFFRRLKVSGNAGCNAYAYVIELRQEPLAFSTRVPDARGYGYAPFSECAGLMEQEEEYIAALLSVASYEVSDERLELENQAGEVVLVFVSGE